MQRLADKVAIVTGGARGLGGATVERLAEEGAKVLVADVDVEAAEAKAGEVEDAGGIAVAAKVDVSKGAEIKSMVDTAVETWGRLDVLVNNAYNPMSGSTGSAVTLSEDDWDYGMAVLLKSMFLGAKYAVPEMKKTGAGNIVNMSSAHGFLMAPEMLLYETGKSAVVGLTKQMATDFGPDGIRVNAVCPGHMVTERIQELLWDDNPSGLEFFADQYPLRRVGKPVEIANGVVFLCSDEASFITGHALAVDGGLTIQLQENFGVRQAHYLREHPETVLPY